MIRNLRVRIQRYALLRSLSVHILSTIINMDFLLITIITTLEGNQMIYLLSEIVEYRETVLLSSITLKNVCV